MSLTLFVGEGNVGKFELKNLPINGEKKTVLNASVRFNVDRMQEDGTWEDKGGFWVEVEYWGKRAELVSGLLQIGSRIIVGGQLSDASFPAKDDPNQLIHAQKLVADFISFSPIGIEKITFKPRKGKQQDASGQEQGGHLPPRPPASVYEDDIPI